MINSFKICIFSLMASFLVGCDSDQPWMSASGSAAGVPKSTVAFERYVSESRDNIERVLAKLRYRGEESPFVGGYSAREVANMRGPFQLPMREKNRCTALERGAAKGFLLIHGLTDSPYLLRNLAASIAQAYPCALIRAVLLPGHGTVVGDTLQMKYQDWMAITAYGVASFDPIKSIEELYLVGFSTGTALAIKQLQQQEASHKIKGLVLLSTALQAKSEFAWLTQYIKVFKDWLGEKVERDAARYSSFSTNSGAQFYQLTQDLFDPQYRVDVPVFMALSADDATINPSVAREFYCRYLSHQRKLMYWYEGFDQESLAQCAGIVEIQRPALAQTYQGVDYKFANVAHTAIAGDPADQHYGVSGVYRDCKAYEGSGDDSQWQLCVKDTENRLFAEKNVADMSDILAGGMWRRGTFNQDYQNLARAVICFVDQNCALKSVMKR